MECTPLYNPWMAPLGALVDPKANCARAKGRGHLAGGCRTGGISHWARDPDPESVDPAPVVLGNSPGTDYKRGWVNLVQLMVTSAW